MTRESSDISVEDQYPRVRAAPSPDADAVVSREVSRATFGAQGLPDIAVEQALLGNLLVPSSLAPLTPVAASLSQRFASHYSSNSTAYYHPYYYATQTQS
jgi:hypothetical protein